MPKFIVNSAGDQFFLPDSSQFYFDDLVGEKHLRYVPNTDHSLRGSDAVESIAAFYQLVLQGKPRPSFSWTFPDTESIHVVTADKPRSVKLWHATNANARDFRLQTIGPAYTSVELVPTQEDVYRVHVPAPDEGWTAYFAELTFDVGRAVPLKMTTPVRVVPDVLPFAR
jgi:PhoPQ-activated pathogenicity-related protein